MKRGHPQRFFAFDFLAQAAAVLLLSFPWGAQARNFWSSENGEHSLKVASSLKETLISTFSNDPTFQASEQSLLRLRLEPTWRISSEWNFDAAYENRLALSSTPGSGVASSISSVLPSTAYPPFRIWPFAGAIYQSSSSLFYQELDRFYLNWQPSWMNLTIGRQAIGWGRGTIFSSVDIFSPFSPLEVDREWRRGVDAIRSDFKLNDRFSLDVVVSPGSLPPSGGVTHINWDSSAFAMRVRGYFGDIDGEFIAGKRATDWMLAATSSATIADSEIHAELAAFSTPGDIPDSIFFGSTTWIPKFLVGISNNFNWGSGLRASAEYHFSGFGIDNLSTAGLRLSTPNYQTRFLRGDTQILGKQALAVSASYNATPHLIATLQILQSVSDFSGIVIPALTWDISEQLTLLASGFVSYGAELSGGILQSQFGSVPTTFIFQIRFYD